MEIQLEKAKKVLKEFEKSGYNAKEALQKAGYKESTASKGSKRVINNAIKKVALSEIEMMVSSSNPMGVLLQKVGLSRDQLMSEYMKIILQDKDFANKLKAMMPLLKPEGISWDADEQSNKVPTLNLTVKNNVGTDKPVFDTHASVVSDNQSHESTDDDVTHEEEDVNSNNMAQQSDITLDVAQSTLSDNDEKNSLVEEKIESDGQEGGGVDSSFSGQKEGTSPIPKNGEIDAIDKLQ